MTNPTPSPDVAELVATINRDDWPRKLLTSRNMSALARAYEALRVECDSVRAEYEAYHADTIAAFTAKNQAERDRDEAIREFERMNTALGLAIVAKDKAERDLAAVDAALARRPALDKPTRAANIEHACAENQRLTNALAALERIISGQARHFDGCECAVCIARAALQGAPDGE